VAIYSCNLRSIGRTTHAAGTAGAHVRYISRPDAQPVLLSEHMPYEADPARNFIDRAERAMRKNGRVIDKLRIALPSELDEHQRAVLVETFMAELTGGRLPWFAAIHQTGKDAHNPHVHIAVHDRDIETGRRVLRLSDNARDRLAAGLPGPKAVEWVRERWEAVCNAALAEAGHDVRIDRRTLEAQGIDRKPGIHEGPRAQHIEGNVRRPESQQRVNGCGRVIDYPSIDHGRTRREFNAEVIDLNLERAARSKNLEVAVWAQFEKEELAKDRALEERLAAEEQQRTTARRAVSQEWLERVKRLRDERDKKLKQAVMRVRAVHVPQREAMRAAQQKEREALKDKQGRLRARLLRILDITGIARRRQEAARKLLSAEHRQARTALTARYRAAREEAESAVKARAAAKVLDAQRQRRTAMAELKRRQAESVRQAEAQRQQREIEREHGRQIAEEKIATWRRTRKDAGPLGIESGFAKAMQRAARNEAGSGGRGKAGDRDRDRDIDRER
jgi:hypothetical protein